VIGPTMRDGAIIYENIARLEDLPRMTSDLTAATLAVLTERT